MTTEKQVHAKIDAIWASHANASERARAFVSLERAVRCYALKLMDLGFDAYHAREDAGARRFWASAATMLDLANRAKEFSVAALERDERPMRFATAPPAYAVPYWQRDGKRLRTPLEVAR